MADVSAREQWESLVASLVDSGRYPSEDDVYLEGLRLLAEREEKLNALRAMIEASIAEGNPRSADDVRQMIKARAAELSKAGY